MRTDSPRLGDLVERLLRPWRAWSGAIATTYDLLREGPTRYRMLVDGSPAWTSISPGGLMNQFLWTLNQRIVQTTSDVLLVHAAAASWGEEGLLFPAAMEAGKTTLVAGLVRAGFDYQTDEAAAIEPRTGRLLPYAKPLSLEARSLTALPGVEACLPPEFEPGAHLQYQVPAEDLRPGSLGAPCPVRYVITPRYAPGSPTKLVPISRGAALMTMAAHTFNHSWFPGRGLDILGRVVVGASCYRLSVGDLDTAVGALADLVQTSSGAGNAVKQLSGSASGGARS